MGLWIIGFFFLFGLWADFVPPPSPEKSGEEIAELYRDNPNVIRVGLLLTCVAAGLAIPWVVSITMVLKRIEGRYAPLAWTNLALGSLLLLEFCVPAMTWQVAAYRSERDDDLAFLLNDMGWIPFMGLVFSVIPQGIVIAFAILKDNRENPLIPRWVGYVNIWFSMTMIPGAFLVFFKDGPFAWNGVLTFWVAWFGYLIWTVTMTVAVIRATYRIEQEDADLGLRAENEDLEAIQRIDLLSAEVNVLRKQLEGNGTLTPREPARG